MNHVSLWDIPKNEPQGSTEHVAAYLREQCDYLKEDTGGRVYGRFILMDETKAAGGQTEKVEIHSSCNQLNEYNPFLGPNTYALDICNAAYKFRLLKVTIPPLYPVDMIVNQDVMDDIQDAVYGLVKYYDPNFEESEYIQIPSDAALEKVLRTLFTSQKVRYILYRLLQMEEKAGVGSQ